MSRLLSRGRLARGTGVILFASAVLVGIGLVRMSTPAQSGSGSIGEGEIYSSIDSLREQSDLVIVGHVGTDGFTFLDSAGNPPVDERGDPLPLYKKVVVYVDIESVVTGQYDGKSIPVVVPEAANWDDWTPVLATGEHVVLFLFDVEAEVGSAEIREQDVAVGGLYGVVGGNQGVFDIGRNNAVSRYEANRLEVGFAELGIQG